MKRDMDIVRRIALETAELEYGFGLDGLSGVDKTRSSPTLNGWTRPV